MVRLSVSPRAHVLPGLALALPCLALAQAASPDGAARLPPVSVTATRVEALPFDVPASIDVIGGDGIRDARLQVNISESLGPVAGLLARDRQNYAQDVQISVRGFGARSTFGIRGVRLYVDGIPATLPDGQGQISNVDLGSAERIEVLRGPFSALYGNSSGGVIQVFTEEGEGPLTLSGSVAGGSDGVFRLGAKASGSAGALGYVVSASHFQTDGYRDHSAAERDLGNLKLTWKPDDTSKLTLVANTVTLPKAQDPLGLNRAQYDANPRAVDPVATTFDTRKTVDQTQLGAVYERRLDSVNSVRALVYSGHRNTEQFQSIPVATQANPKHPGGVIALGRDYSGTDLRWTARTSLDERPLTLVAGLAYDTLGEHRFGYENFIGTTLGVQGALRRDENNDVSSFDQYLQAGWQFAPRWSLNVGVRHSKVAFSSTDHYVVGAANPDDSGSASYTATLPVVGLMFAATDAVHLYATAGRGFETPTLNELSYRPNGATGLNFALHAARSDNFEAGIKTRSSWGDANVAVFYTRTHDEIVTLTNLGGRSTFQNVGSTGRRGLEASWSKPIVQSLRAEAAYTWLDARYRESFATCSATPCAAPDTTIPSGNRIPGIPRSALYAALAWAPPQGWRGGIEGRALSRVYLNDANRDPPPGAANSGAAAGYAIASANLGYLARIGNAQVGGYARVDNLLDRKYAGSVIVNEGNARYFEPAPGRTWTVGLTASLAFR